MVRKRFNNRVILIHVEFRDNTVVHVVSAWRAEVLARKEFRLCTCVRVLQLATAISIYGYGQQAKQHDLTDDVTRVHFQVTLIAYYIICGL